MAEVPQFKSSRILVIGVGNSDRRDDGAGLEVIRQIQESVGNEVDLLESSGDGFSLMESWRSRTTVFLVDAACGGKPGTVVRVDGIRETLKTDSGRPSTHSFGVPEAVTLSRVMGYLPQELILIGVVGSDFSAGRELSSHGREGVRKAVDLLRSEIALKLHSSH